MRKFFLPFRCPNSDQRRLRFESIEVGECFRLSNDLILNVNDRFRVTIAERKIFDINNENQVLSIVFFSDTSFDLRISSMEL